MISIDAYRKRIGYFNCGRKKSTKSTGKSVFDNGYLTDTRKPSHILASVIYFYFIMIFYLCFANLLLGETNAISSRIILEKYDFPIINMRFYHFIGHFYHILIAFIIRKSILSPSYRRKILVKLSIKSTTHNHKNCSHLYRFMAASYRFMAAIYLWILLINFLLIAICNPSLKNPGPQFHGKYSVFYCNVQGLIPFGELGDENPTLNITKMHELNHSISVNKPDIVIYNETWLKSSIHDSEVLPTDIYKVFRLDRSTFTHPPDPNNSSKFKKNGGGVLIGIKHNIDIESKLIPVKCRAEILGIELTDKLNRKSIISTFYRVGTLGSENHNRVKQYLHTIRKRRRVQEIFLIGDLNLPAAQWDRNFSQNPVEQLFLDTFSNLSLHQLVEDPTHYKGNILDVVLTDKPELVTGLNIDNKHGVCGSDHYALNFHISLNAKRKKPCKRKMYNFKQANWTNLNNALSTVNWVNLFTDCSVEVAWTKFRQKLIETCNTHIPKITVSDEFQPPWFDSEVFESCRKKRKTS